MQVNTQISRGKTQGARKLMMKELGKYWFPKLEVHHKNRDPKDNRIENLCVTTKAIHMAAHKVENRAARRLLLRMGLEARAYYQAAITWVRLKELDLSEIAK